MNVLNILELVATDDANKGNKRLFIFIENSLDNLNTMMGEEIKISNKFRTYKYVRNNGIIGIAELSTGIRICESDKLDECIKQVRKMEDMIDEILRNGKVKVVNE